MANLGSEVNPNGLPRENMGLPPLNLDECSRDIVPTDWDITGVLGDILMCEYVDENLDGEIMRNGIWLKRDITKNLWRVVKVLMKGPTASENITVGEYLMVPGDRGIPSVGKNGKRVLFINEPRVFAKVAPKVENELSKV